DLLPKYSGVSIPPLIARYDLKPLPFSPLNVIVLPLLTKKDSHQGISRPSTSPDNTAPAQAITASPSNFNVAPAPVVSIPASVLEFPTRRFAIRYAKESIGPEGGTPICQ